MSTEWHRRAVFMCLATNRSWEVLFFCPLFLLLVRDFSSFFSIHCGHIFCYLSFFVSHTCGIWINDQRALWRLIWWNYYHELLWSSGPDGLIVIFRLVPMSMICASFSWSAIDSVYALWPKPRMNLLKMKKKEIENILWIQCFAMLPIGQIKSA